jgi:trehalose 2-sulfotransferase
MGAPLEYLLPDHAQRWQEELSAPDLRAMLLKLFERRTSPNGWFGIKAHWDHFEFGRRSGLDDLLRFDRFIRIERRDRIAQAVSLAMARQTRAWVSMQEQQCEPTFSERDISRALATLENQSRSWASWAAATGVTPLQVYYEDLVADPLGTVNVILREFGLSPMPSLPEVVTSRQASAVNEEWKRRYLRPASRAKRQLKAVAKRVIGRS